MTKLKLGPLADDKPVKLTIELPAAVHRDVVAYAEILGRMTGQAVADPAKLIAPMVERFIATDRAFTKARSNRRRSGREVGVALAQKIEKPAQSRVAIGFLPVGHEFQPCRPVVIVNLPIDHAVILSAGRALQHQHGAIACADQAQKPIQADVLTLNLLAAEAFKLRHQ